ncbi:MAG TPA: hypothetical protein VMV00_03330 [Candidatus Baltobacteraceae bacterium]|nr:hypothetical protein [Candidatus Baltobacteraceae bacterium]
MRRTLDKDFKAQVAATYRRLDTVHKTVEEFNLLGISLATAWVYKTIREEGVPRKYMPPPTQAEREKIVKMSKTMKFDEIVERTGRADIVIREVLSINSDVEMANLIRNKGTEPKG